MGTAAVDFTEIGYATDTAYNTINYNTAGYMAGRIIYGTGAGNILNIVDGGSDRSHFITYEGNAAVTFNGSATAGDNKIVSASLKDSNKLLTTPLATTHTIASISKTGFASANQMTKQATDSMSGVVHTRLAGQKERNGHDHYY